MVKNNTNLMSDLGIPFLLINTLGLRNGIRESLLDLPRQGLIWAHSTRTSGFVELLEVIQEALGDPLLVCNMCLRTCVVTNKSNMTYCRSRWHVGECYQKVCTPWQCTQQRLGK